MVGWHGSMVVSTRRTFVGVVDTITGWVDLARVSFVDQLGDVLDGVSVQCRVCALLHRAGRSRDHHSGLFLRISRYWLAAA